MSEEKSLVEKFNSAIADFVGNILGNSGKQLVEDAQKGLDDTVKWSIDMGLNIADSIVEALKIKDNENIRKARETVVDSLTKAGLMDKELE